MIELLELPISPGPLGSLALIQTVFIAAELPRTSKWERNGMSDYLES